MPTETDSKNFFQTFTFWFNAVMGALFAVAAFMTGPNWDTLLSILPDVWQTGAGLAAEVVLAFTGLITVLGNLVDWIATQRGANLAGE